MGLRYASGGHPNVAVMAPALTEATQSQSFKFSSPTRTLPAPLSLKKHLKKETFPRIHGISPRKSENSNGLKAGFGMNGHPPHNLTYSINGLAKNLKNEFLSIEKSDPSVRVRGDGDDSTKPNVGTSLKTEPLSAPGQFSLTHFGGFIMNNTCPSGENENMGLQKDSKDPIEPDPEAFPKEVDQLLKNLVIPPDLQQSADLHQNVDDILEAINSMDGGGNESTGPADPEGIFSMGDGTDIAGGLTNFERELFNDVDVMNMCVDESLVAVNRDTLMKERLEEVRKRRFQVQRKCDFLLRRLQKMKAKALGKHACEEITGVLEYSSNLFDVNVRTRNHGVVSGSDYSESEVKCEVRSVTGSKMSMFMRQLDHAASQQATSLARSNIKQCKYFGSGSSNYANGVRASHSGSILPPLTKDVKSQLQDVSGGLKSQLRFLQQDVDSDITESSSGCESCDEFTNYNNAHQQTLSIRKRAMWKWAEERASIAAKWTWLQAQMADLDYKIRQQNEIRRQIRSNKGVVRLQDTPVAVRVPNGDTNRTSGLNGCKEEEEKTVCSRTRSLVRCAFRKRKLIQVNGFHKHSKKVARPSNLRCSCRTPLPPCVLCTGREDPTLPRDPLENTPLQDRIALLDPSFHPVLSFSSDISQSVHYDALMKVAEWQARAARIPGKALSTVNVTSGSGPSTSQPLGMTNTIQRITELDVERKVRKISGVEQTEQPRIILKHPSNTVPLTNIRRKLIKGKRRRKSSNTGLPESESVSNLVGRSSIDQDTHLDSVGVGDSSLYSPVPSPASSISNANVHVSKDTSKRKRENSYDIDNIVIPYSMASSTRLEKLNYKEILTPKWRRVSKDERTVKMDHKNGVVRRSSHDEIKDEEEDMSEETIIIRHEKCEIDERNKFLSYLKLPNSGLGGRGRGQKRTDSRAESSGPNTPDPLSPGASKESGGGDSPITSPPPTPQQPDSSCDSTSHPLLTVPRKRTVSLSKPPSEPCTSTFYESGETHCYEPRVFPLSDEEYKKLLVENNENHHFPALNNSYKSYVQKTASTPGSPNSYSTDSADSFLGEDPNDPEWTVSHTVPEKPPSKR